MMEEKKIFGALTLYRGRGLYLQKLEQFVKSIEAYDEALAAEGQDVRALLGRSQAQAKATMFDEAIKDAVQATKLEPKNLTGAAIRAQTLYEMCEFEKSLIFNYRGLRLRKQPPVFANGINQGQETLEDCIGENAGDVLYKHLHIIRKLEDARPPAEDEFFNLAQRKPRVQWEPEPEEKIRHTDKMRMERLGNIMAQKYLGRMWQDKAFLKALKDDPRLISANSGGSVELKKLSEEAYNTLVRRQDVLRTRRPYYAVQLAETRCSLTSRERNNIALSGIQKGYDSTAQHVLGRTQELVYGHNLAKFIEEALRARRYLLSKSDKVLPEKWKYLKQLYEIIGYGYLLEYRLDPKQDEERTSRRVQFLMGLPVERDIHRDSVIDNHPVHYRDTKKAMNSLEYQLMDAELPGERSFLIHEIIQLQLKLGRYNMGKFYASRLAKEAEGDRTWLLNAGLIKAKCEVKQDNRSTARTILSELTPMAAKLSDDQLSSFLRKAMEYLDDQYWGEEEQECAVAARENAIVFNMPDNELSKEAQRLFKRMSVLPVSRRFSVLPGRVPHGSLMETKAGLPAHRLSIKPQAASANLPHVETGIKVLGFQRFE